MGVCWEKSELKDVLTRYWWGIGKGPDGTTAWPSTLSAPQTGPGGPAKSRFLCYVDAHARHEHLQTLAARRPHGGGLPCVRAFRLPLL